jgi:hypothetical protein
VRVDVEVDIANYLLRLRAQASNASPVHSWRILAADPCNRQVWKIGQIFHGGFRLELLLHMPALLQWILSLHSSGTGRGRSGKSAKTNSKLN